MKKIFASLSAFILIIVGILALSSCSNKKTFYSEWHAAGAEIEKENVFKSIDVEEASSKIAANESFALFLGSSSDSSAVKSVTAMQATADVKNYEGKVYFITTTEIMKSTSKRKDANNKLGNIDIGTTNDVFCVIYKNGSIDINTLNPKGAYEDRIKQFKIGSSVNIVAVMEYVIELYPVAE